MQKRNKNIKIILDLLDENYPLTKCYLNYQTDWQLLIATILSAQCTDDRVNMVTKDLFRKYKTLKDFASASQNELEQDIKSTGFYKNKARNIILAANKLLNDYDSKMPSDINELIKFPGVGRKTANVIRSHIFNIPSIVVDTHVKRISKKLGFTENNDPEKIEYDLMKIIPQNHWISINLQLIAHGRKICKARKPDCTNCFLNKYCRGAI
jgi:endonuclease III